jgi:hypothetical protein
MSEQEIIQRNIEEFSRLQNYMSLSEKDSPAYKAMYERYIDLKVILASSGVNVIEIDRIKS